MRSRPIGIALLAGIQTIVGLFFLMSHVLALVSPGVRSREVSEMLNTSTPHPTLAYVASFLMAIILFAAGIGLWFGARPGWWLTTFFYANNIGRSVLSVVFFSRLGGPITQSMVGAVAYGTLGGRALISLLLLVYLLKSNVLAFFDLAELRKRRAAAILVAFVLASAAASFALSNAAR